MQLERWKDALRDYERLKRELPEDAEVARSYFDAQVALKKHHGEETLPKWFGGQVEDITSNDQLREALSHPGTDCEALCTLTLIKRDSDMVELESSLSAQIACIFVPQSSLSD